jgi:hypothetical protein
MTDAFSQLKVLSDGSVEVNSYAGNWARCLQTKVYSQYSCAYHLNNSYYGGDVFYVRGDGYVWTRNGFLTASDSIFKTNIVTINSPLSKIKSLRGVTYNRKYQTSSVSTDSSNFSSASNIKSKSELKTEQKEYGLIAQEVEKVIPEVVQNMHDGTKAIAYQNLVPVIIEALKEQQSQIETLQKIVVAHEGEIVLLKKQLNNNKSSNLKSASTTTDIKDEEIINSSEPILYQNTPNPFTNLTEIKCYVPSNKKGIIFIHDLQGSQIKSFNLTSAGLNTVQIIGSELQAGLYVYTLVIDNTLIDSKRMILTKE